MANPCFQFKQFTVYHHRSAMKVTTDSCFFGAWAATEIKNAEPKIERVLDIGTGTGLLSLMIVQKNKINIDAVELDGPSADQAMENIRASPWPNKIKVYNTDILSFDVRRKYDCIISNPPFYENELASEQERKNLAHHSSRLSALDVIKTIEQNLKEGGLFFLMYPFKRKTEIEKLISKRKLSLVQSIILKQSFNHKPFRYIIMGRNQKTPSAKAIEICIWDDRQQYTREFTALLSDYYWHL